MKYLLKLTRFRLKETELRKLTDDQLAAFSVLCFAVSELNAILRLVLLSNHSDDDEGEIDHALSIHQLTIIRFLSSKLIEVEEFLRLEGKYNRTRDERLRNFMRGAQKEYLSNGFEKGSAFARLVRNEAAFHYKLAPARRLASKGYSLGETALYISNSRGNSFYPLGENLLHMGLVKETIGTEEHGVESEELIAEWVGWATSMVDCLNTIHSKFFREFVYPLCEGRRPEPRDYWVKEKFVAKHGEVVIPLFLQVPEAQP